MTRQSCAVCAWRENCSKRFSIPDNGSRCPDYSRDVSIKDIAEDSDKTSGQKEHQKK
jgi:hypothetical protein